MATGADSTEHSGAQVAWMTKVEQSDPDQFVQDVCGLFEDHVAKKKTTGDQEGWSDEKWMGWYLDNHPLTDLIPLNLWKRPRYIVSDVVAVDGAVEAIRAAYLLDGHPGAIGVLAAVLQSLLPPGTYVPELPEDWKNRVRFWGEKYKDPTTRPKFFGVYHADR